MAIIKCKMCGGNLISSENGFGVCDSCGLQQSLTDNMNPSGKSSFDKYLSFKNNSQAEETESKIEPLIKRAFLFLEDGNWKSANEYCEKILDIDPEYAPAYLCKLMIEYRAKKPEYLSNLSVDFSRSGNYQKALRYGDETLKTELNGFYSQAKVNIENAALRERYNAAASKMNTAKNQKEMTAAAVAFRQLGDFQNAASLAESCDRKAEELRKTEIYNSGLKEEAKGDEKSLRKAVKIFDSISDFKDSASRSQKCENKLKIEHSKSAAKSIGIYVALGAFIIIKLVCSGYWASFINPSVHILTNGLKEWLNMMFRVVGLMPVEVVLTSIVSILASKCKYNNFRLGGIIMFVLTVIESFMMSAIRNPQIFGDRYLKVFAFYLIFSIVCNFTVYIIMLFCQKAKKSLTK